MRARRSLTWLATAVVALGITMPALAGGQPAAPRPNVVYIVADDLGWKDVGFHGSDITTPNLDRLAAGGVRLEAFYAQPFCTPTRAALLTGRYPYRYGLQTAAIPSAATYGLATDEWLLPEALKAAGYTTLMVGKWHLGHADRTYWPRQRGFDYHYGPVLGEIDYFTHAAHGTTDWYRDNALVDEKGYVTELLGRDAVRQIQAQSPAQPFFLYVAFTAPHAPYQAPAEYLARYQHIADPNRRAYAAMVTAMDEQIGRIVAALDERGLRDNTLIVFHSDNGGPRSAKVTGEVDTSGGTIPADNGPYRDGKGMLYEGGTRVAALMNWPGHLPAGAVVDEAIHVVDVFPTLTALAGAPAGKGKPLDGMNVWPTIADRQPSPRHEVVYDIEPFRAAIRQGDYKLVWRTTLPPQVELFNLATDPSESTNIAADHPDKVAELEQRAIALSRDAVPPLFMTEAFGAAKQVLFSTVATPTDAAELDRLP